jgi:endonuclease-3 related protein
MVPEGVKYGELRAFFESGLPRDEALFNDFHAQIVELGKRFCRPEPECARCPLRGRCPEGGRRIRINKTAARK